MHSLTPPLIGQVGLWPTVVATNVAVEAASLVYADTVRPGSPVDVGVASFHVEDHVYPLK